MAMTPLITLALIGALAPGVSDERAMPPECEVALDALWDWEVNEETLDGFSRRLSPPPGEPSLDACVQADARWKVWLDYDRLVELFDSMRTWKRCAHQVEVYETWEECRDEDRGLCSNLEFERRLQMFGIEAPAHCEDILPVCEQLLEVQPQTQDECWSHHQKIEKKCGSEDQDQWMARSCGAMIGQCSVATEAFVAAEVGDCREPYERLSEACPDSVIYELDRSGDPCMRSLQAENSEECHQALVVYSEATPKGCAGAASELRRWCEHVPGWESSELFEPASACAQMCDDAAQSVSVRPFCAIPEAGAEACVSAGQLERLDDAQRRCADQNKARATRFVLPTSIGFGIVGVGLMVTTVVLTETTQRSSEDPAVVGLAVATATSAVVSLALVGASVGLLSARRPDDEGRSPLVTVTKLLTGQPIRF